MSRSFGCLAASSILLAAVGCDIKLNVTPPPQAATPAPVAPTGPPPETNNALILAKRAGDRMELTMQLRSIAQLAFMASLNNSELPPDYDAAIAADPINAPFYQQLRDAGVIVIWDATKYEKQVGASNTIVAYGPWVLEQGGPVATIDGRAEQISAEDLKAKLEAMGKLPAASETPADTVPAETAPAEVAPPEEAAPATPANP